MDIPLTRTFKGDVIHYEVLKSDTIYDKHKRNVTWDIRQYTDITYITPKGKIKTQERYELAPRNEGTWQYLKIVNNRKFYVNNVFLIILISVITMVSGFGTLFTIIENGIVDIGRMFNNQQDKLKGRCLRVGHVGNFIKFFAICPNSQALDEAIENVKNSNEHKYKKYPNYRVIVPTYLEAYDEILEEYDKLTKQKENESIH